MAQTVEGEVYAMQKITPFLWFDGQAEEAVNFYNAIFKNSKIVDVMRYGDAGPGASHRQSSAGASRRYGGIRSIKEGTFKVQREQLARVVS